MAVSAVLVCILLVLGIRFETNADILEKKYSNTNFRREVGTLLYLTDDINTLLQEVVPKSQGKMKKQYKGQCDGLYTETLSPTPDKITRAGMARTFQNIRLWKTQTVFDNVLIAKHCRSTSSVFSAAFRLNRKEEAAQQAQVEELLEIVGLSDVKNELATSLPYGKQRRLEIARALAAEPKLLLLDEPAAGMNPQETEELTAFIGEIREKFKITILLIEHHMNLVMGISDRIYVLDFGKLIAHGTPAEIQKNQRVIDAYLGVADDA